MIRDLNAYKRLLTAILPRGRAWRGDDAFRDELLTGEAVELARVDTRMNDLLVESDVRTTTELIGEHETDFGLPDYIFPVVGLPNAQRRDQLLTKLRMLGGLNKQYYIDRAADLGWTITITEYTPAWCGMVVCGDPCGGQKNIFYWRVNIDILSPRFVLPFADGSVFADGSELAGGQSDYSDLMALIQAYKPVHTIPLFTVTGPGFSNGFSTGFASMPAQVQQSFSSGFNSGFK